MLDAILELIKKRNNGGGNKLSRKYTLTMKKILKNRFGCKKTIRRNQQTLKRYKKNQQSKTKRISYSRSRNKITRKNK
jgi:hypothetical protein